MYTVKNFRCKFCDESFDKINIEKGKKLKCPKCKKSPESIVVEDGVGFLPQAFPSDGVYLEHVSSAGKTFRSKTEMKKYAKDNKLELGYL